MKWFAHDIDASADLKLVQLEQVYGNNGYAVFFKCLELVGEAGKSGKLSIKEFPLSLIGKRTNLSVEELEKIMNFMADLELCDRRSYDKGILYFPKLVKRADDYSKRMIRITSEEDTNMEERKRIASYFVKLAGYNKELMAQGDWNRIIKRVRELWERSRKDESQCIDALNWINSKGYNEWSIETLLRKYPDFLKECKSSKVKELEELVRKES